MTDFTPFDPAPFEQLLRGHAGLLVPTTSAGASSLTPTPL